MGYETLIKKCVDKELDMDLGSGLTLGMNCFSIGLYVGRRQ